MEMMTMKRILVYNSKGGVGKTTLSLILAELLKDSGIKVRLIDMDPNGSTTVTKSLREDAHDDLNPEVEIVDTAPLAPERMKAVAKTANLIVIVTTPGILDLARTIDTMREMPKGCLIVLNQVRIATPLAKNALEEDSQLRVEAKKRGHKVLKNYLGMKSGFQLFPFKGIKGLERADLAAATKLATEIMSS